VLPIAAKLKAVRVSIVTMGATPVQVSLTLKIATVRDSNNTLLELAERTPSRCEKKTPRLSRRKTP